MAEQTNFGSLTVLDWMEGYLDEAESSFTRKTFQEKESVFKRFIASSGLEKFTPVADITKPICKSYLKQQNKERSGYAANKDRKNLAAAWNWGQDNFEDDWPEILNPFHVIKKFPEKRNPRYVPPEDDFWKVYNVAKGQDRVMLLTFLHLAARKGEVFAMKKSDLDFSNARARLWTRKRMHGTLEPDWLPMTTELEAALKWWIKERMVQPGTDPDHVFVNLNDLKPSRRHFGKPFTKRRCFMISLCKKAKVTYFDYHAIRHLSATVLYRLGYSLGHIQLILRHKSPSTTERYLKRLGLEMVRSTLEDGLKIPAKVISFKTKDADPETEKAPGRASS